MGWGHHSAFMGITVHQGFAPHRAKQPHGVKTQHWAHLHLTNHPECGSILPHASTLGLDLQTVLPLNMSFLLATLTLFGHPLGFQWVLARTKPPPSTHSWDILPFFLLYSCVCFPY